MPPIDYIALRLVRRLLPSAIVQSIMRFGVGIEPGLETREPVQAADRYLSALNIVGGDYVNKRILVLGYGGYYGLAVELLQEGAAHIVLLDPFAKPKHQENLGLAQEFPQFLRIEENRALPDPGLITLSHNRVGDYLESNPDPVDLVLSSSVLEHIPVPLSEIKILSGLTMDEGHHVHVIDLRDHYFKYPFEMLTYTKSTWDRFLNPPSNLNRLRMWEYEGIFQQYFLQVHVNILEGDREAFKRAKGRIRPEFLSGDEAKDSAYKIVMVASEPIRD